MVKAYCPKCTTAFMTEPKNIVCPECGNREGIRFRASPGIFKWDHNNDPRVVKPI